MPDDTENRKGVLLPTAVNDQGGIRGVYVDQHGLEPVQLHPGEGKRPEGAGVMRLRPRQDEFVFDAEVVSEPTHKGPARVSTSAYKSGWDRIWGNQEIPEA